MRLNTMRRALLAIALVIALSGCAVSENMQDGYDPGDVTVGMADNYRRYCSPIYVPIRTVGRWIIRLIAYPLPVPNPCPNN